MSEFVPVNHVLLDQSAASVDDVLRLLADKSVELGLATNADAVYEAFKAREAEGTTGMTGGFAIPHAKSDAISKAGMIVAKFTEGVEWASMDDAPITCAIAILTPAAEAGTTHLQLLSKTAVLLMNEGFRSSVQGATDAEKIASLINEGLDEE